MERKREEEIKQVASFYQLSNSQEKFIEGAKWADQNPRKGLWDSEKVIDWILNNYPTYEQIYTNNSGSHCYSDFQIGEFIRNLRKAMEVED